MTKIEKDLRLGPQSHKRIRPSELSPVEENLSMIKKPIIQDDDSNLFNSQPDDVEENEDENNLNDQYSNTFSSNILSRLIEEEKFRKQKMKNGEDLYNIPYTTTVKGSLGTYHYFPSHTVFQQRITELSPVKEKETMFPEITHFSRPSPDGSFLLLLV